jgi:hypothetical protein
MLKFETMIKRLATMKAHVYLSGGYGGMGTEIAMVAQIYQVKEKKVVQEMAAVYPKIYRKLAGA